MNFNPQTHKNENEFIEKGKKCFIDILNSYKRILKKISTDMHGYPSVSNLFVESEINKIMINFEEIQIILNESMQQNLVKEDFGRFKKKDDYSNILEENKKTMSTFITKIENYKDIGENLLALCERKYANL